MLQVRRCPSSTRFIRVSDVEMRGRQPIPSQIFNEVFSMAISTVLQCYIADEEMFEPADRSVEGAL